MEAMNLGDPELELVDPTPNVHMLFVQFDKLFFCTKLASRAIVRWSKRMYSCAGVCSYEGRGGVCDIALSEPLLRLRPRKDLVETLLHEMIHAFLFITQRDQDRDGHGPQFQAHMHRINKAAGLNITIYHDFHDEVKLYQTHWWRCNGPCQKRRPHFGIVRRSMNRAPGPADYWWHDHKRQCGGTFVKIKEPENKKPATNKTKANTNNGKKRVSGTSTADITKYITSKNNIKTIHDIPDTNGAKKPVLKDSNIITSNVNTRVNSPASPPAGPHDVIQHIRNIWSNKYIPAAANKTLVNDTKSKMYVKQPARVAGTSKPKKHKAPSAGADTPPAKLKKVDDDLKANATSVLKDLYGQELELSSTNMKSKLVAVSVATAVVACPVCNEDIGGTDVNRHLDECLNKEIIKQLTRDNPIVPHVSASPGHSGGNKLNDTSGGRSPTHHATADASQTRQETNSRPSTVTRVRKAGSYIADDRNNTRNVIIKNNGPAKPHGDKLKSETDSKHIHAAAGSGEGGQSSQQTCPCCESSVNTTMEEHLDECLAFFGNDTTIPEEGAAELSVVELDDDDDERFDESQALNATGTKWPCPCCMRMVEHDHMNQHLDLCLRAS